MKSIEDPDFLLSREQVEARFGISRRFLEKHANGSDGPKHVKIGRLTRYRVKDVRAWLDTCVIGTSH
jgi:predicted DNA-binding transcriptional regulator AlpA